MTKIYSLLIASSLVLLIACGRSASKAYDHGNYTEAIAIAVRKLQKDPNDIETQMVLKDAYKYAVTQHEEQIRNLSASNMDTRWEQIYQQYMQLQSLYTNIHQSPAAVKAVKPTNYADYVNTYKDKTADAHYQKGLAFMKEVETDRAESPYRKAYAEFKLALNYKPFDSEILRKVKEAKDSATINVVIAPVDPYSGFMYSNVQQVRSFENDVVRNIRSYINSEFIEVMTEMESRSKNIKPDEVIEMRLNGVSIGQPQEDQKTREVSKEVVMKEIVHKPDSVTKQYGKVYARITTTRRTQVSTADLLVTIRDSKNGMVWNDNIRGEHRWTSDYAIYNGDERALSEEDKTLLNRQKQTAPREEEIIKELLKQVQSNIAMRLRSYYTRY